MDEPIEPRFEGNQLIIETCNEVEMYDSQFLVAVLLVYVAKADGEINQVESNRMLELIRAFFATQCGIAGFTASSHDRYCIQSGS